jgi:hypothetical protein
MKNAGTFDVVKAVNLLGASVKEHDAAIGMFGSGVKYALAQALREGHKIVICSGDQMFKLCYRTEEFRGKEFQVAYLQGKKGAPKKTAITSEFGSKDWTDSWFIFREFWSNMLDEKGEAELVDEPVCEDGVTSVYLEYKGQFKEIYDNIEDYFVSFDGLRSGTGRIFRQGVLVGQLDGLLVDLNDPDYSAKSRLINWVSDCKNVDVLIDFWRSDHNKIADQTFCIDEHSLNEVAEAHHEALETVYHNYIICPNLEQYVKDAQMMGYVPIIEPSNWTLDHKVFRRYDREREDILRRDPNPQEQKMLDKALVAVSCLIPADVIERVELKVAADEHAMGSAKGNQVCISEQSFRTRRELTHTLLHELNHVKTNSGDYDREFATSYETMLLDLIM